jgi:hypothetical protein
MAQIMVIGAPRHTIQDLKMVECDLWEAERDARDEGLSKMADCLGRMLGAVRSMLTDLGEEQCTLP